MEAFSFLVSVIQGARVLDDSMLQSLGNLKNKFHSQHKHGFYCRRYIKVLLGRE